MTTRAERRQAMRQAGYRRSSTKRGRRAAIRTTEEPQRYEALEAKGFVTAKPKLHIPE